MSTGQAKIELLLELRNRIKAGLSSARDALNQNLSSMRNRIGEIRESHIEAFKAMRDEVPGLGRAIELITNPYALATTAVLTLGAAYLKAGSMAKEWQTGMAKTNVTAQLSKAALQELSGNLLDIGKADTGDIEKVPETFNNIVSAGFDVNTSLATLKPTLLAAKAGFTEAGIAADAATNLMGSTGITDATRIYDVLFATVNKGKAEFADIANYLPKIIPGARMAGVSLEQTAGAYAFLTASGLKAEAASTALANAMKSLSDPEIVYGSKTKGGFKALGVDIFDAHGKMRDLVSISADLGKSMNGLTDEQRVNKFAKIGLDMESSMAFAKMSQGVKQLKEDIDFTTNSQGQLNEAVNNAKEPLDSWKRLWNQVKGEMIASGQGGLTALGAVGDWIEGHKDLIKGFGYLISGVAASWGLYTIATSGAAIATGLETAAMWALNLAMNANPVGLLVTGIGLLVGGLVWAYKESQTFRASLSGILEVGKLLLDVFIGFGKVLAGAFTLDMGMIREGLQQGAGAVKEMMDGGISKAFNRGYTATVKTEADEKAKEQAAGAGNKPAPLVPKVATTPTGKGVPTAPGNKEAGKTTGSAQQIKNLTINMEAMVKMGDFVSKNPEIANMGKQELEEWFKQVCARMLLNLETSFS